MAEPLSLQHTAQLVCIRTLLDLTHGKDIREYLKLANHSAVTEDLLNVFVRFYPKLLTDDILAGLISPHIQNLRLVNCSKIKPSKFIRIFPHCKKLQGLDLKQCSQMMLPDFFQLIKMAGFHLTSLCVEDCSTVNDDVVHSILRNLHHLRHLNVSSCHNMTDKAFVLDRDQQKIRKPLVKKNTEDDDPQPSHPCLLTSIDLSGCRSLSNTAIRNIARLTGPTLQHVCMSWTRFTLESLLYLSGLDYPRNVPESEDEVSDSEMKDEDTYSENGISDKVNTQKVTKSDTTSEAILEIESANSENQSHEELEIKHEECVELVCKHNLPADLPDGHEVENANSLLFAKEKSNVKIVEGKCSENSVRISNITDTSQENYQGDCDFSSNPCVKDSNFGNVSFESSQICDSNKRVFFTSLGDLKDNNQIPFPMSETNSLSCSSNKETHLTDCATNACCIDQIQVELNHLDLTIDICKSDENIDSDRKCTFLENQDVSHKPKTLPDEKEPYVNNSNPTEERDLKCDEGLNSCDEMLENFSSDVLSQNIHDSDSHDVSTKSYVSGMLQGVTQKEILERVPFGSESDPHFLSPCTKTNSNGASSVVLEGSVDETKPSCFKNVPIAEESAKRNSVETCFNNEHSIQSFSLEDNVNGDKDDTESNSIEKLTNKPVQLETSEACPKSQEKSVHKSPLSENVVDLAQYTEQTVDKAEPRQNFVGVLQPSEEVADSLQRSDNDGVPQSSEDLALSSLKSEYDTQNDISVLQPTSDLADSLQICENDISKSDGNSVRKGQTMSKHERSKNEKMSSPSMTMVYKSKIRSIDLEDIYHPNNNQDALENTFRVFVSMNPCLQILKLSWPKFPNYLLKHLVDTCDDLRELTLVGCLTIDAEHIRYIGTKCKKLQKLELDDIRRLTDWSVASALSNNDLETLSLKETDIHDVTAVRMAAKLTENLKSLDVSYCQELSENGINSFLRKKSSVTSFGVRQGVLSDLSLGLMCDNFRQLRSLDIASVKSITGRGLITLAKNLHHLESIDLSWTSNSCLEDDVILSFLTYCPRMNTMKLNGQARLTSKPFLPIISDYLKWCRCKALFFLKAKEREFDANQLPSADSETDSSDDEYEDVCFPHRSTTFATSLQHLTLEYCDSITDSDMTDIVTVCRGSLAVIDYYSCDVTPNRLRLGKYKIKTSSNLDVTPSN
uniref:Uncharacterized protein LOC111112667 isoform X1 n=1 Tax=Crassostrea virginica TaxID=6565 RepID=A0A8B8BT03_CRAVI|nr:uncharacterized protein LOC111112667 isoform X1 [Crassostrea virginica]